MSINSSKNTSTESSHTPHDDDSHHSITQSILTVILVFIESALTLALRFDPKLRQTAYPLAKAHIVVCVRTYLPHTEIYATFTQKGILLDSKPPVESSKPHVVLNAYSAQLINLMVSHDVKHVNKLSMRGPQEIIDQVRNFLMQLGLGSFIQGILKSVKNKKEEQSAKQDKSGNTIEDYRAQLDKKQSQLDILTIKNRELEISKKELESKQKTLLIALAITALIALVCLIGWIVY